MIKLKVNEGTANFFISGPGEAANSQITLGFEMLNVPTGATSDSAMAVGCAATLNTAMTTMLTGLLVTGWQYRGVNVKLQRLGDVYEANLVAAVVGSTVNAAPPSVAALVNKITGVSGRRNRGRWFIPGVLGDASIQDDGTLSAAYLGLLQPRLNAFLLALAAPATAVNAQLRPVLLHNAPVGGTVSPNATPITVLQAQSLIATQRRRLR